MNDSTHSIAFMCVLSVLDGSQRNVGFPDTYKPDDKFTTFSGGKLRSERINAFLLPRRFLSKTYSIEAMFETLLVEIRTKQLFL